MKKDKSNEAFLALLRAGLWEKEVKLLPFGEIDFASVLQLAEEQSVVGLIAAGLEHVVDTNIPKKDLLQFIGQTLQLEEQNKAMNNFIGVLVAQMDAAGIFTLLVKGQGVAQCYERPLWRACGDVDFLLSDDNYQKAKPFMGKKSTCVNPERFYSKHKSFIVPPWSVELHGTLRTGLSERVDKEIDRVKDNTFCNRIIRFWQVKDTLVSLPEVNDDIFFVFTHFVMHFYGEQLVFKQICDWCRLLWSFRDVIDMELLKNRLDRAGLMEEWCSFAALAVNYLGMPVVAMPLYSENQKWSKKAEKILTLILMSEYTCKIMRTFAISKIFPKNTISFLPGILCHLNWLKIKERILGQG